MVKDRQLYAVQENGSIQSTSNKAVDGKLVLNGDDIDGVWFLGSRGAAVGIGNVINTDHMNVPIVGTGAGRT